MADNIYVVLSVPDTHLNLALIPIWICFCQDKASDHRSPSLSLPLTSLHRRIIGLDISCFIVESLVSLPHLYLTIIFMADLFYNDFKSAE